LRATAARLVNVHGWYSHFLVDNIGGALSPLRRPPVFIGFLRGVDFFWPTAICLRDRAHGGNSARGIVANDTLVLSQGPPIEMVGETLPLRDRGQAARSIIVMIA